MLDPIRSRLVERVASGDIGLDLGVGVTPHGHVGDAEVGQEEAVARSKQGNSGVDLMRASAQAGQHGCRFRTISGLAKDVRTIHYSCICREDKPVRIRFDCARFCFGKP